MYIYLAFPLRNASRMVQLNRKYIFVPPIPNAFTCSGSTLLQNQRKVRLSPIASRRSFESISALMFPFEENTPSICVLSPERRTAKLTDNFLIACLPCQAVTTAVSPFAAVSSWKGVSLVFMQAHGGFLFGSVPIVWKHTLACPVVSVTSHYLCVVRR